MDVKCVGVASDHAGFPLKQFVLQYLEEKGYPFKDYGTWSDASVDYPDYGHALAEGIESGEVYPGIAIESFPLGWDDFYFEEQIPEGAHMLSDICVS